MRAAQRRPGWCVASPPAAAVSLTALPFSAFPSAAAAAAAAAGNAEDLGLSYDLLKAFR